AEGKHDYGHYHHQPADAVGEETTVGPQVTDAGLLTAATGQQQIQAKSNHGDDGSNLDDGEPELGLTKGFYVGQIDYVYQREEGQRRGPGRYLGIPLLRILAPRCKLRHAHQYIEYPVVPAGQKAGKRSPVRVCKVAERSGHRLFHNHLAQLTHDQEGYETADSVAEQHGGSGALHDPGRSQEQASADSTAQR